MSKVSLALLFVLAACGNPPREEARAPASPAATLASGEVVKPPFAVAGEAEGLLLVWYDAEGGAHPASKRSEIPEAQRKHVRVDSLDVAPDKRLDPAFVYVADLSAAQGDGSYAVRKLLREAFEQAMVKAAPEPVAAASNDVILYGASWCGACRQARQYLESKGIAFVEKDIEKQPGARQEMMAKAQAQGVRTSGIPIIDVKGKLMAGFDPRAIDAALKQN
jgi:glutaredoxin